MIRPGETINASVLATSIRVKRPIEGHVRCLGNLIDDALGAIEKNLPLNAMGGAVFILPFDPLPINLFAKDVKPNRFKAIARIDPGPPPMREAIGERVAVGKVIFGHPEHHANAQGMPST